MAATQKIIAPDFEMVNLIWIDQQLKKFQITDYELSLRIGQPRNYIGQLRCGNRNMSKGIKVGIYYFFKTIENK